MKYEQVLELVSDQPFDYNKLRSLDVFLTAQGIHHTLSDVESYCLASCQDQIRKKGPSAVSHSRC